MLKILKYIENIPTTENILEQLSLPYKTRMVIYDDLDKHTLTSLFANNVKAVILYLRIHDDNGGVEPIGHWVCLIKHNNNKYEYFDPYGYKITDSFVVHNTHENPKLLMNLFKNNSSELINNPYRFQKISDKVSVCGLHVASRIFFNEIDINTYWNFMNSISLYSPDDMVSLITLVGRSDLTGEEIIDMTHKEL
jgi:hypothetical protein